MRALTAPELAEVWDLDAGDRDIATAQRALWSDDVQVFPTLSAFYALPGVEVDAITRDVIGVLGDVCPAYTGENVRALETVALADAINIRLSCMMADSQELLIGSAGVGFSDRPDLYYGVSWRNLTDGQLMVYRAACRAVDARRPQPKPQPKMASRRR